MNDELVKLIQSHGLKIWYEDSRRRWCISGQAGVIATCLRATREKYIQIEDDIYPVEEVTHQIYQMTEIKLAFRRLFSE